MIKIHEDPKIFRNNKTTLKIKNKTNNLNLWYKRYKLNKKRKVRIYLKKP